MASSATVQSVKQQAKAFDTTGTYIQGAIALLAKSDCPVLISGEAGVGKSSVAMRIHAQSHRSRGVFTQIQCADCDAQGLAAAFSTKGTVYLSEIGDLAPAMQGLIVDQYFSSEQPRDCRLLFGTGRELHEEVKAWRMREDFFHLVSSIVLRVPPLRCRKTEILSIADALLTQYSRQFDRPKPVLHRDTIEFLTEHDWPGNLPELQTAIKTIVAIGDQSISLAALRAAAKRATPTGQQRPRSLKEATRAASVQIERQLISEVLYATGGNRKRAADELGISYKALLYKLKQAGTGPHPAPGRNGSDL